VCAYLSVSLSVFCDYVSVGRCRVDIYAVSVSTYIQAWQSQPNACCALMQLHTHTAHASTHTHTRTCTRHTPNTQTITHQPAQVGDVLHEIDGHVVYRHPVHQLAPLILGQVCSRGLENTGQSEQRDLKTGVRTKCVRVCVVYTHTHTYTNTHTHTHTHTHNVCVRVSV